MTKNTIGFVSVSRLLLAISPVLLSPAHSLSQSVDFQKVYFLGDYSRADAVASCPDSGAILVGKIVQGANTNILYLRVNAKGDTLWTRTLTLPGEGFARGVVRLRSGDYVLTGEVHQSLDSWPILLVRFSPEGDTAWTSMIDGPGRCVGYSVLETTDGGFLVFGALYAAGSGQDAYILRTDNRGRKLHANSYGFVPGQDDYFASAVAYHDSVFYGVGNVTTSASGDKQLWLVRVSSVGDTIWTREHTAGQAATGKSIAVSDVGIFITGSVIVAPYVEPLISDCYVARFTHQGVVNGQWQYGQGAINDARSIVALADGGFVTAGITRGWEGGSDNVYLVRAKQNGDTVWTESLGGPQIDIGSALTIGVDTKLLVVGQSFDSTWGVFIAKLTAPLVVGVGESAPSSAPQTFSLSANYPNPFNPSTTIRYALPHRSQVTLSVYNTLGQQVTTLVNRNEEAGYHDVKFDGTHLASGVYVYRIQASSFVEAKKLLLIR